MASPFSPSEDDDTHSSMPRRGRKDGHRDDTASDRKCKICGDRAVGYNFSVISCESCKAFFRRNANREKVLSCPFTNSCEVNTVSRRFCQSCRLKKCFEAGMKKEWILLEGNRRTKKPRLTSIPDKTDDINKMFEQIGDGDISVPKQMLVELVRKSNVASRPTCCQCKCTCGFYPADTPLTAFCASSAEPSLPATSSNYGAPVSNAKSCTVDRNPIASCMDIETRSDMRSNEWASYANGVSGHLSAPITQLGSVSSDSNQSPFMSAVNATIYSEFGLPCSTAIPQNCLSSRSFRSSQIIQPQNALFEYSRIVDTANRDSQPSILMLPPGLDDHERFFLQELIMANNILKQPLELSLNQKAAGDLTLMEVVRITDLALRRIICMAKELSNFRSLGQHDQIALLKGSCSELLILRGVMAFDSSKDVWNHHVIQGANEMEIKLDVLKRSKESLQHYEEHKRFLTTFSEKWRRNENVMLLLNAITLFCPDRPNVNDVGAVTRSQQYYYGLLKKYLALCCAPTEADQAYDMLLRKLIDLHQLNQSMMRIYYGLNINEVDPLSLELFDLAQHR